METVLVIDADSLLGRTLCDELNRRNYRVIAHVRTEPHTCFDPGVDVVSAPRVDTAFFALNPPAFPIAHVVFGQAVYKDETPGAGDGFEQLVGFLEEQLSRFLAELQAAGQALARGNGGQIWVLTQEDSMHYYMGLSSLPIDTRARHAAVKSFAKEIFRFGVRINCANVQLLAEQAAPDEWQRARDGLKAFAMKFKPNKAIAVAKTMCGFLAQPDLPIAGIVVPIGIGFAENNI